MQLKMEILQFLRLPHQWCIHALCLCHKWDPGRWEGNHQLQFHYEIPPNSLLSLQSILFPLDLFPKIFRRNRFPRIYIGLYFSGIAGVFFLLVWLIFLQLLFHFLQSKFNKSSNMSVHFIIFHPIKAGISLWTKSLISFLQFPDSRIQADNIPSFLLLDADLSFFLFYQF